MPKKHPVVLGVLSSLLYANTALSNQASTEFVRSSISQLRSELSTQFNTGFNQLEGTNKQLTSALNRVHLQLEQLSAQNNDHSATSSKLDEIQKKVNELPIITHQIGEVFQGGMVFYVDNSQQHGLMVSLTDVGNPVEWRNGEGGDHMTNATAQGLGSGESNTRLIIAQQTIDQQEGQFAALAAGNYHISADGISPCATPISATTPCFGGWYLPSIDELILLHSNLKPLGLVELKEDLYWSSTEGETTQAWLADFATGESFIRDKSTLARIRAIHAF